MRNRIEPPLHILTVQRVFSFLSFLNKTYSGEYLGERIKLKKKQPQLP